MFIKKIATIRILFILLAADFLDIGCKIKLKSLYIWLYCEQLSFKEIERNICDSGPSFEAYQSTGANLMALDQEVNSAQ